MYVFLMDAKTVLPIISKLGIVIEGIFCSILNYKRRGTQGEGRIGDGGADTRAKPGLLLVIYKWASYFSLKYVSNAQNTFVLYLGGSNLNISAVFLSTQTPLPVLAAILDF